MSNFPKPWTPTGVDCRRRGLQLLVAASGDHVAVTIAWDGCDDPQTCTCSCPPTLVTTGRRSPSLRQASTGRRLFVLADHRLIVVLTLDWYAERVLVSNSASDWSQLQDVDL